MESTGQHCASSVPAECDLRLRLVAANFTVTVNHGSLFESYLPWNWKFLNNVTLKLVVSESEVCLISIIRL